MGTSPPCEDAAGWLGRVHAISAHWADSIAGDSNRQSLRQHDAMAMGGSNQYIFSGRVQGLQNSPREDFKQVGDRLLFYGKAFVFQLLALSVAGWLLTL